MIDQTIQKIEQRLRNAPSLSEAKRAELLNLLGRLRSELDQLPDSHTEQAQSVTAFADVSTHEATRDATNPDLLSISLQGLESSVSDFEASHPKLVEVVNALATMLSSLGI